MKTMAADVSGGDHHQLAGLPLLQTLFPHVEISRINTIELVSSPFPWQDLFFYYLKKNSNKESNCREETRPTGCVCVYI